jgi:hypothetical protein
MRHNLNVVALICAVLISLGIGGYATEKAHQDDWDHGWNAGFAARSAQVEDANSRLIASGICRYADLACAGRKH